MKLQTGLLAAALAATSIFGGASAAQAFTVGGHYDGAEFDALGLEIPWAAESRIGLSGNAEHELNIHDIDNDADNRVQAHFEWGNNQAVDFSLVFDSGVLTYTVAGVELSKTNLGVSSFSDLYIRTSARIDGSSVVVDNLAMDNIAIAETSSAACSGGIGCGYFDAEYLHIGDLASNFTLTGKSTMTWAEGSKPSRSQLAYQIKLVEGETESVPEPAALSLLSLGVLGLALKKRR